jgi:hypothetical protein
MVSGDSGLYKSWIFKILSLIPEDNSQPAAVRDPIPWSFPVAIYCQAKNWVISDPMILPETKIPVCTPDGTRPVVSFSEPGKPAVKAGRPGGDA